MGCQATEAREESSVHCRGTWGQETQGFENSELLLGWTGFYLQVLRGHHGGCAPRRHHQGSQDQLDVSPSPEAQGAERSDCCWQVIPWAWKGSQVQPNQGRFQESQLAQEELPQAPQEALDGIVIARQGCILLLCLQFVQLRLPEINITTSTSCVLVKMF